MLAWRFRGREVLGKHVPYRGAMLLVHRSPCGHLATLAGFKPPAVIELQFGNPAADRFSGRTGIAKTADANHVAALLVIGVGIEEIVADVFENIFDLTAGHAHRVALGIADRGLAQHVLHGNRLDWPNAVAPAEA